MIPTFVYRFYDAEDVLLYVGITHNTATRWHGHSNKAWWAHVVRIAAVRFDTRALAEAEERRAIKCESPLHNKTHSIPVFDNSSPLGLAAGEYRAAQAEERDCRKELRRLIVEARDAGERQSEIVRQTGFTREAVRQILDAHDKAAAAAE